MIPNRVIYWNIPAHLWLYALFLPFLVIFLRGCYRLGKLVWLGQPDQGIPPVRTQLWALWEQAVLQKRLLTQPFAGGMHAAISWGFGILLVATCMVALQDYLGIPVLSGNFYLYFMSFTVDVFGIAATVGIVLVWIPKDRKRVLKGDLKGFLAERLGASQASHADVEVERFSIQGDQVHRVAVIPPKYAVSAIVGKIKANTSREIRHRFPWVKKRYWRNEFWSEGFFSSTVGIDEAVIKRYVEFQEKVDTGQFKLQLDFGF
jgi:putative transposase